MFQAQSSANVRCHQVEWSRYRRMALHHETHRKSLRDPSWSRSKLPNGHYDTCKYIGSVAAQKILTYTCPNPIATKNEFWHLHRWVNMEVSCPCKWGNMFIHVIRRDLTADPHRVHFEKLGLRTRVSQFHHSKTRISSLEHLSSAHTHAEKKHFVPPKCRTSPQEFSFLRK